MEGREKDKNTRTDDFKTPGNEHSRKVTQAGLQPQLCILLRGSRKQEFSKKCKQ